MYTIKQLADIAGISVRTLHYYDEVGLLKPSSIKENGYRYYAENEVLRLQQILFFRELEFSLDQIAKMLNSPNFDRKEALKDQKKLLNLKKERIERLLASLEKTINSMKGGDKMTNSDLFGSFTDDEMKQYKEEAQQRWGHTDAYKQSVQRTKNWTKADYKKVAIEGETITRAIAENIEKGIESKEVQRQIEKHFKHISQFYDCSYEMYRNLGKMYVDDKRFTAYYDNFHPGLAEFMHNAIDIYCKTHEK